VVVGRVDAVGVVVFGDDVVTGDEVVTGVTVVGVGVVICPKQFSTWCQVYPALTTCTWQFLSPLWKQVHLLFSH